MTPICHMTHSTGETPHDRMTFQTAFSHGNGVFPPQI